MIKETKISGEDFLNNIKNSTIRIFDVENASHKELNKLLDDLLAEG